MKNAIKKTKLNESFFESMRQEKPDSESTAVLPVEEFWEECEVVYANANEALVKFGDGTVLTVKVSSLRYPVEQ